MQLVSSVSAQVFPGNTLRSCTIFLLALLILQGELEVAFSELFFASRYQNNNEGKFRFFDKTFSKSSEFLCLEHGVHPSITGIVEAMSTLKGKRLDRSETCTNKVSRNN